MNHQAAKALLHSCQPGECLIPFRTVKAACSAAISDRKVPSSAKADSVSIDGAGESGSCLRDVDDLKAEG